MDYYLRYEYLDLGKDYPGLDSAFNESTQKTRQRALNLMPLSSKNKENKYKRSVNIASWLSLFSVLLRFCWLLPNHHELKQKSD